MSKESSYSLSACASHLYTTADGIYTHSISIYPVYVCVCNHSDVAHSALDRSNGISVPMKPPGYTIPALSQLKGTIHLQTNIPYVLQTRQIARVWTPRPPLGFNLWLALLIFWSKWLCSNRNAHCQLTYLTRLSAREWVCAGVHECVWSSFTN